MKNGVMNIGRFLSDTARRLPGHVALVWGDQSWTWREVDDRVNALVAALKQRGITKGDPILVHSRNNNQLFESAWAAFKLGAIWTPTNVRLAPPEVAYMADHSGAKAMIYEDALPEHADAALSASDSIQRVISIGQAREGEESYEDLIQEAFGAPSWEEEVESDDACWFFYTSGTTGRPKAAMLTHGQQAFVVTNHIADLMPGLSQDHASLVVAPLSHGAGAHMLPQVARGAKSVLLPGFSFDEEAAWRLVEEHRITNMFTVPVILNRLARHPALERFDHSSLQHIIYAGAPMYREDQKNALKKLGKVIVQYYGLGEVTGNITVLPANEHSEEDSEMRVGTCGYVRTAMEIAIKSPDGERLNSGEQGEISVRGPAVFKGYFSNPEANEKSLKAGWFHTGDLGYLDVQGYLFITGRASDMFISGGSNVYPREIEELLLTHPAISEVAVLGVPDPKWGEAGVAVIICEEGQTVAHDELYRYMDGKLARYKLPKRFFIWDELPKSGYGKVPKHLIRKTLFERGDLVEGEAL